MTSETTEKRRWQQPAEPGKLVLQIIWLSVILWPVIIWAIIKQILPAKKKSLEGQIVLITGAGNGLGRALALKMAAKGCKLALVDINEECVTEVAKEINQEHEYAARSYVANLGKLEDIKHLSKQIITDFDRVDILVNNAGVIYGGGPILDGRDQDIEAMFTINVVSHFRMIREFLGDMLKRNHGHIVAMSSSSSYIGLENASVYTSTKWALNGMMETLRTELKTIPNNQVKVSIVAPYFIDTNKVYTERWDVRVPALPVDVAAKEVIEGIEREDEEFTIPGHMYMFLNILKVLPRYYKEKVKSVFYARVQFVPEMHKNHNSKIIDSLKEETVSV